MAKKTPEITRKPKEKAFLVGVEIRGNNPLLSLDDSLTELALLGETAGLEIIGQPPTGKTQCKNLRFGR
jgi:GTP-binding protein HflX